MKHSEMKAGVLYGHSYHPNGNGLRAVMVLDSKQIYLSKRWSHPGEKRFHPVGGRIWRPRKGYLQDAVGYLALWADPEVLTSIDVEEARREALEIVNDSENDDAVEQKYGDRADFQTVAPAGLRGLWEDVWPAEEARLQREMEETARWRHELEERRRREE